ncbi:hypothetical protein [Roseomonas fluvialis]|uniref:Uncharacterized protein n=1 Tax=Roseomonas fluvialis TaxID=1750527 RepID=A0ABM7Y7V7_9PROT|nr:hypothetical protein [Roseomonas fluvialis]BDG74076.1 hypothetical protein Rmf_40050 [Roseomonas fluvialis]
MTPAPFLDWSARTMPRPVLCLNLARTFGWCAGVPGAHPDYGTVALQGRSHGVVYADLLRWLHALIRQHQPAEIAIEPPLGSQGASTTRLAYGLAAHLHLLAHHKGIPVLEEPVANAPRGFGAQRLPRRHGEFGSDCLVPRAWLRA